MDKSPSSTAVKSPTALTQNGSKVPANSDVFLRAVGSGGGVGVDMYRTSVEEEKEVSEKRMRKG
eukprot:CAMPEP_0170749518 /NCGR_PEP_ID=MMETSP0437-20130122/10437_1 /TAXON_ID=0 /ORGANISM="Sexangularia sp." /LENGTH=63 /DNA_ID=CAMNT_0011088445 /DNA_START=37 /DNA_END=225 /DNA_ORIENTATION=+